MDYFYVSVNYDWANRKHFGVLRIALRSLAGIYLSHSFCFIGKEWGRVSVYDSTCFFNVFLHYVHTPNSSVIHSLSFTLLMLIIFCSEWSQFVLQETTLNTLAEAKLKWNTQEVINKYRQIFSKNKFLNLLNCNIYVHYICNSHSGKFIFRDCSTNCAMKLREHKEEKDNKFRYLNARVTAL